MKTPKISNEAVIGLLFGGVIAIMILLKVFLF